MAIFPGSAIPSAVSDYEIENSLRFNVADVGYLSRNISANGNRKTWTLSVWVKRGELDDSDTDILLTAYNDANNWSNVFFTTDDHIRWQARDSGSNSAVLGTTAFYRDPSSWYHVVVTVDTTQGTDTNRCKIYVNGTLQDLSTTTYPSEDYESIINNASYDLQIGRYNNSTGADFYLAEYYFIDGTALTPTSFAETSSTTNQWKPLDSDDVKDAVNFGTNGFYQKYNSTELATSFADSAGGYLAPAGVTSVEYLVVGGGGGGGGTIGGGGGAGGFRTGTLAVTAGTHYTVTVGAAGAAGSGAANGGDGGDSVFATITATGGGGGGSDDPENGRDGGSGGGGGTDGGPDAVGSGGSSTAYGNDGGSAYDSSPTFAGGGGGGSGAVGGNGATGGDGGDGGAGTANSITGASVTYAGGGGGSGRGTGGVGGTGGSGGGGNGSSNYNGGGAAGTAGTANTGSGGGGGDQSGGSAAGGSGVVIIKDSKGTVTSYTTSQGTVHTITAHGDATNQRPQHHAVTANGDAHLIGPKVGTSVFHANSSGDYIGVPSSSDWGWGTGDFTVEGWFNVKTGGHNELINCGGDDWRFAVEGNGKPSWNHSGGPAELTSSIVVASRTWFHLAVSRSSGTTKLFVDGVERDSASDTESYAADALTIGSYSTGTYGMDGYAEQIRISDVARYTADFTPSTDVLTSDSDTQLLITNGTDGTQTFDDLSTSDHTLTANGDVRWFAPKVGAGAMAFDGTGDYFTVPDNTNWSVFSAGDRTFEGWFKLTDYSVAKCLFSQYEDASNKWEIAHNGAGGGANGLEFGLKSGGSWVISSGYASSSAGGITDVNWHHIALVKSGTTYTMYLDGTALSNTVTTATTDELSSVLYIGNNGAGGAEVEGYADMIRISQRARYTGSFTPSTAAFTDDINTSLLLNADINQGTWNPDTSTGLAISTDSRIKFGSGGNYLKIADPDFPAMSNWTFETWVRFEDDPATSAVNTEWGWGTDVSSANVIKFAIQHNGSNYGSIRFIGYLDSGSNAFKRFETTGTTPLHQGQWHHIVWSQAGSTDYIFVDGVSQSVTRSEIPSFNLVDGDWGINGLGPTGFSYNEECQIDEVRLSNVTRYTSNFTPATRGNPFTADANTLLLIHSDYTGGLGADSSGNYNNFTATNLVATDQMIDTPTNSFATFNALSYGDNGGNFELREGNLQAYMTSGVGKTHSTFSLFDDGCYWEMMVGDTGGGYGIALLKNANLTTSSQLGADSYSEIAYRPSSGNLDIDGSTAATYATASAGDILNFAFKSGRLYVGKSNTWFNSGNPAGGSGYVNSSAVTGDWCAACSLGANSPNYGSINFGADSSFAEKTTAQGNQDGNEKGDFYYEPPSGFLALCTDNLSTPEIKLPGENFNTVLYTGNNQSAQSITGVGFEPDLVWIKRRNYAGGNHVVFDQVRGVNKELQANADGAEGTRTGSLNSFDSDGWTTSTDNGTNVNLGTYTYVNWNWKAGGAPTADNSAGAGATPTAGSVKIDGSNLGSALAGSIAATRLSANTESGFSIVRWIGNGTSSATIAHGLSETPELIINKNYSDTGGVSWVVYSSAIMPTTSNTDRLVLNSTAAEAADATIGAVTATTWEPSNTTGSVNGTGASYVTYCWHSVEGYSKIFSFTGNNNADGPFLYTGFKPAVVIGKCVGATGGWEIIDSARNTYNVSGASLYPNTNAVESVSTTTGLDFLSNGIKVRTTSGSYNQSNTMLAIAFAESPFKYSNAR